MRGLVLDIACQSDNSPYYQDKRGHAEHNANEIGNVVVRDFEKFRLTAMSTGSLGKHEYSDNRPIQQPAAGDIDYAVTPAGGF